MLEMRLRHWEAQHGILGFETEAPVDRCAKCKSWLVGRPMQHEHECPAEGLGEAKEHPVRATEGSGGATEDDQCHVDGYTL